MMAGEIGHYEGVKFINGWEIVHQDANSITVIQREPRWSPYSPWPVREWESRRKPVPKPRRTLISMAVESTLNEARR